MCSCEPLCRPWGHTPWVSPGQIPPPTSFGSGEPLSCGASRVLERAPGQADADVLPAFVFRSRRQPQGVSSPCTPLRPSAVRCGIPAPGRMKVWVSRSRRAGLGLWGSKKPRRPVAVATSPLPLRHFGSCAPFVPFAGSNLQRLRLGEGGPRCDALIQASLEPT